VSRFRWQSDLNADVRQVGYNVQASVNTKHHLIVAHDVTNEGTDRAQLAKMAKQAKAELEGIGWMSLPTAAISTAKRSWPARRPASPSPFPNR